MTKHILTPLLLLLAVPLLAQNELYISTGGVLHINGTADQAKNATSPELYIAGELVNAGTFTTTGEWQITGNVTHNGTEFDSDGDDIFVGTGDQTVGGTSALDITDNHFHNFMLDKPAGTDVILSRNVMADENIIFLGGGVINTGVNHIFLENSLVGSLSGYGAVGALDKFVQGELRRATLPANTYPFPVGYSHTAAAGAEGAQYANLTVNGIGAETGGADGESIIATRFTRDVGACSSLALTDCGGVDVVHRINHGQWEITDEDPDDQVNAYDLNLNAANVVNDCASVDFTIGKSADGATGWGFGTSSDNCDNVATTTTSVTRTGYTAFTFFQILGTFTDVLPVELLSFKATPVDDRLIRLDWVTASEDNAAGFQVERSLDGSRFEAIGWVDAAGFSSSEEFYGFDDEKVVPHQLYFYRLKMQDFDGSFEYSETVSAKIGGKGGIAISIVPNPTSGDWSVLSPQATGGTLYVTDELGRLVHQADIPEGETQTLISSADWPMGVYFVKVVSEGEVSHTEKLLRIR